MLQHGRKMRRNRRLKMEMTSVKGKRIMATMTLNGLWHMLAARSRPFAKRPHRTSVAAAGVCAAMHRCRSGGP